MPKQLALIASPDLTSYILRDNTFSGKSYVSPVISRDDYEQAIYDINEKFSDDGNSDGVKVTAFFHGDGGVVSVYGGESFSSRSAEEVGASDGIMTPMGLIGNIKSNGKPLTLVVHSCQVGVGIHEGALSRKELEEYRGLPENAVVILNSGKRNVLIDLSIDSLDRTLQETNDVDIVMNFIAYSPETIKFIAKKDGALLVHTHSALKPSCAEDLSDDKVRDFLGKELDGFVDFYRTNIKAMSDEEALSLSQKYKSQITADSIKTYKEQAFILECFRINPLLEGRDHAETISFTSDLFKSLDPSLFSQFSSLAIKDTSEESSAVKEYYKYYVEAGVDLNSKLRRGLDIMDVIGFSLEEVPSSLAKYLIENGYRPNAPSDHNIANINNELFEFLLKKDLLKNDNLVDDIIVGAAQNTDNPTLMERNLEKINILKRYGAEITNPQKEKIDAIQNHEEPSQTPHAHGRSFTATQLAGSVQKR